MAYGNYEDPRFTGSGVTKYGQLNPNMTAANSQRPQQTAFSGQRPQSPMLSSLQRAPQVAAPSPPSAGLKTAATGTFGPKTNPFQGMQNRNQRDFGKGGHQGPANAIGSALNVKSPFGAALGIQRRAKGSGNDYGTQDANSILQRGYQNSLGRQASPQELQSQLSGQGLKGGDRWVGKSGLDSILASLGQSEEGQAYSQRAPQQEQQQSSYNQPDAPVNQMADTQEGPSPMMSSLQPKQSSGAQSAYQEYVSEFGPEEQEQPLPFEQFQKAYSQLPQEQESPMANAAEGRRGWENLLLDTQGEHDSPMAFNGFNMDRAMSGGDPNSVKDSFARAVSTFDIDLRNKSKEEVGQVLASPEFMGLLAQQGIQARPIPGAYDQIEVFTKERGWETKDIVSSAGSGDAAWWWGDVGGNPDEMGMPQMTDETGEEPVDGKQSAMLSGLTGGSNWKALLDQLMEQYAQG